jgi:2-oxoglutarate ferredoxin oxidoreductase subunit delta
MRDAAALAFAGQAASPCHTARKENSGMSSPRLEIVERYCKGCSICVEFCPTNVLEMDGFLVKVVRPDACIGCMQCELRCPDFAIKVHKD